MTTIFLILAVLLGAASFAAWRRPDAFRIERSIHIDAPPERIYALIADLRRFNTWNPFARDKKLILDYSGPQQGAGAAYDFSGPGAAGRGRLAILDAAPGKVTMQLTMSAPLRCENTIEFLLAPGVQGTGVSWIMLGRSPFVAKLMGLLFDTDRMVGRELETGLAALRDQAEAPAPAKAA
ncbi:SRPBCC family protein [Massilia suwonensis]|uniref:SRPBCC family protein n=1 Tax=Massilia suwonensis TaxID=648895 RepID=A0ABW0MMZ0_9BURK